MVLDQQQAMTPHRVAALDPRLRCYVVAAGRVVQRLRISRQSDAKVSAAADAVAAGADRTAMQLDQTFADRKAETEAGAWTAFLIELLERSEQAEAFGGRKTSPAIGHLDLDLAVAVTGAHAQHPFALRVLDGVAQQIPKDLAQPQAISVGDTAGGVSLKVDDQPLGVDRAASSRDAPAQ